MIFFWGVGQGKTEENDEDEDDDVIAGIYGSSIYITIICSLNLIVVIAFNVKKIRNVFNRKYKRKKLGTWLFKKNQIVKKSSLPSKYELQEIRRSELSDDVFDDDDDENYDEVNFDAKLYVNRK